MLSELCMCTVHTDVAVTGYIGSMLFRVRKLVQFNIWILCYVQKALCTLFCYFLFDFVFSSHPLDAES